MYRGRNDYVCICMLVLECFLYVLVLSLAVGGFEQNKVMLHEWLLSSIHERSINLLQYLD